MTEERSFTFNRMREAIRSKKSGEISNDAEVRATERNAPEVENIMLAPVTNVIPADVDVQDKVKAFLLQPIVRIVPTGWTDMRTVTKIDTINDWKYLSPGKRGSLNLSDLEGDDVTVTNVIPADVDAQVKAFLLQPIVRIVPSGWTDMPTVTTIDTINDWKDLSPGKRGSLNLRDLEGDDVAVVEMGLTCFESLRGSITQQAIAKLLVLTYNLRDTYNKRIFSAIPPELLDLEDITEIEDASNDVIETVTHGEEMSFLSGDLKKIACSYCYLAGCMLRLYTRAPENFQETWTHIQKKYENFFDHKFQLNNFAVKTGALKIIQRHLDLSIRLKNTFYNLLYAGEVSPDGRNLKDSMYGIHVAYTGLHPFTLFYRCMETLKQSNNELALAIYTGAHKRELEALKIVFNTLVDNSLGDYRYQMWKYARIFNSKFLSELQTKKCQMFTLILANILHEAAPNQNSKVLEIAQIKNMSEKSKFTANVFAKRALRIIQSGIYQDQSEM